MAISFSNFFIVGSDGNSYRGIRPSLVPSPFKHIEISCRNGKKIKPIHNPEKKEEDILGFYGSIKVLADVLSSVTDPNYFYRLVVLYKDETKWSVFYDFDGNILGGEWG